MKWSDRQTSRRQFVAGTLGSAVSALVFSDSSAWSSVEGPITFGLCADVHQDVMHDGEERIGAFVHAMNQRGVDFIAQLGDFCIPKETNRQFLEAFHRFGGAHYHVLGNHDTDSDNLTKKGYSKSETRRFWGMEANYYTFVLRGVRFVVLDGNDLNPAADPGQYPRHVGDEQRQWLDNLLSRTDEPLVFFSHQSLQNEEGLDNAAEIRAILEQADQRASGRRVLASFSGHHHLNDWVAIRQIPYVQINSMSYFWVGENCENFAYPRHIHDSAPMLQFTAPYRDPIWSVVTLDPASSTIQITGRASEWAGQHPDELGYESPPSRRQGMEPRSSDWTIHPDARAEAMRDPPQSATPDEPAPGAPVTDPESRP